MSLCENLPHCAAVPPRCAESPWLSGTGPTVDLIFQAGCGKAKPFRTAGGRAVLVKQVSTLALVALAMVWGSACRVDMHVQPRLKPDDASTFFQDGRANRPEVPDTVARGHARTDELLYTGRISGVVADQFPFPITREVLERGRGRFNIYCSPCHDYTGSGRGMIVQRGFPPPPSYHLDRLRQAPAGHFFEVMTDGYGAMFSYAGRITPEDRWAIVAYIRALQLSQHAALDDVPAKERAQLMSKAK